MCVFFLPFLSFPLLCIQIIHSTQVASRVNHTDCLTFFFIIAYMQIRPKSYMRSFFGGVKNLIIYLKIFIFVIFFILWLELSVFLIMRLFTISCFFLYGILIELFFLFLLVNKIILRHKFKVLNRSPKICR